jgi:hemolysin D
MKKSSSKNSKDILEYQPDAVEIEERPVSGRIRWVLYLILGTVIVTVIGAIIFKVDRFVVAQGRLVTTMPTIVVQSLNAAVVRSIDVKVGDVIEKDQVLVTLDPTFASADLSQLSKKSLGLGVQIRRIEAELQGKPFSARPEEGEDGKLQEQVLRQRQKIVDRNKKLADDKIAALRSKLSLNAIQRQGQEQQLKLLRDVEGTTAMRPQIDNNEYRLRLLEAQKTRTQAVSAIENLKGEEQVTINELKQAESDWQRFLVEQDGKLMEQEVQLRNDLEKVVEDYNKAKRMHELVFLRSPQKAIVLKIAERSVGSIIQPAEPFVTLVPSNSDIEVEVDVQAKDIGRIRVDDPVRVKLDAFPFQRHDTLPGKVRVISEDAFSETQPGIKKGQTPEQEPADAFYRTRISLSSTNLRAVPDGFRLMPGMKVRAEIKVGRRTVISYFLYPVIRALDESMREP